MPGPGADLVLAPDEVLVLPPAAEDGGAVVLAPSASLAALERAGIMTPRAKRRPFQQLINQVAGERKKGEHRRLETLADEPLEGGYLKLSEESRRQLAEGKPVVTRTGELLGMVNDDTGQRRHLLRFTDYKVAADPSLVMAAANLQAMAGRQEQLEAVEERLIEVQKTLQTLCKELDRDRLASITAATEILEETARHIRRRGRMTSTDLGPSRRDASDHQDATDRRALQPRRPNTRLRRRALATPPSRGAAGRPQGEPARLLAVHVRRGGARPHQVGPAHPPARSN